MATQKPPTPQKRRADGGTHPPRNTASPQRHPPARPNASHQEHQTRTPAQRARRQQTFGQRLRRLSGGTWLAILTGALVVGVIIFAIFASQGSAATGSATAQGLLAVGKPAPDIAALPAADGGTYSLAQYKGQKVVVLEFFAPWCPHCQNETKVLKQLQQEYGDKGVQVLSVSASAYGRSYEQGDQSAISMSDIQWYANTFGLNYPALFDPSLKAGNDYHITGFPTQYIVDRQGIITYAGSGEISYTSLQQQVNQALNQSK
jgi:peroxiredoxin